MKLKPKPHGSPTSARLRRERERVGLTQAQVAYKAKVDATSVRHAEHPRGHTSLETQLKIGRALGIPAGKLVK